MTCFVCTELFTDTMLYISHLRKRHGNISSFPCYLSKCYRKYHRLDSYKYYLNKHLQNFESNRTLMHSKTSNTRPASNTNGENIFNSDSFPSDFEWMRLESVHKVLKNACNRSNNRFNILKIVFLKYQIRLFDFLISNKDISDTKI